CREVGLSVRVASLPEGSDPDEFVRDKGPEALLRAVKAAPGILEFLIDQALDQGFRADDARGQAARIRAVSELLAQEEDVTVRALAERHVNQIAERLGIADAHTFRALGRAVQAALRQGRQDEAPRARDLAPWRARSPEQSHLVAREILGAILDYPELLELPEIIEVMPLFEGDVAVAVAALRQCAVSTARQ